jgi:hypothetical protein
LNFYNIFNNLFHFICFISDDVGCSRKCVCGYPKDENKAGSRKGEERSCKKYHSLVAGLSNNFGSR